MMENNNNSGLFTGGMGGMGTQSQLQVKWEARANCSYYSVGDEVRLNILK